MSESPGRQIPTASTDTSRCPRAAGRIVVGALTASARDRIDVQSPDYRSRTSPS